SRWRPATSHPTAMLRAVTLVALAAWRQSPGYQHGDVTLDGLVLSLAGLVVLTVGGWLGGSVVFVHGTRVIAAAAKQDSPPSDGGGSEVAVAKAGASKEQAWSEAEGGSRGSGQR